MNAKNQRLKLVVLGVPLLILVFASLAVTAFLAVNLIITGVRELAFSSLILGTLLGSLWVFMFVRTAKARRAHGLNTVAEPIE